MIRTGLRPIRRTEALPLYNCVSTIAIVETLVEIMTKGHYSLAEVLAVAKLHPFYNPEAVYPPDALAIEEACRSSSADVTASEFASLPLLTKDHL